MITADRVVEIAAALRSAGTRWPATAKALPEYARHGRERDPYRAWVLLNEQHEDYDLPVRLSLHENGHWYPPGTYLTDVDKDTP